MPGNSSQVFMLLKELLPKSTFSDLIMQSSHMLVQTLALYLKSKSTFDVLHLSAIS